MKNMSIAMIKAKEKNMKIEISYPELLPIILQVYGCQMCLSQS